MMKVKRKRRNGSQVAHGVQKARTRRKETYCGWQSDTYQISAENVDIALDNESGNAFCALKNRHFAGIKKFDFLFKSSYIIHISPPSHRRRS
jgi:hypothetical protein